MKRLGNLELATRVADNLPTETMDSGSSAWRELVHCSAAGARDLIPHEVASRLKVLPIGLVGQGFGERALTAVFSAPLDPQRVREAEFACGYPIVAEEAPASTVSRAIHAAYRGARAGLSDALVSADQSKPASSIKEIIGKDLPSDSAIPKLLSAVLDRAITLDASDIHIETHEKKLSLRYRVNGFLRHENLPSSEHWIAEALARRIKIMCDLNTTLTHVPQEGGFTYNVSGAEVRVRVSFIPVVEGEKIVLRVLHSRTLERVSENANSFQVLGMLPEEEALYLRFLAGTDGTILLSGPTGSGKSTLLYASLRYLNTGWRNIVTIEDPVEQIIPSISQTSVSRELGLDYADLLAPLLRQDPDIVMLGEIRDSSTAQTALTAGLTGHLVLSTIHAGNCIDVCLRLIQMKVDPELLGQSIRVVVGQRLVPINCKHCERDLPHDPRLESFFDLYEGNSLRGAVGCPRCEYSGVSGRKGVFELLPITTQVREALRTNSPVFDEHKRVAVDRLKEAALASGYRPLIHSVRSAVAEGLVSPGHALHVLGVSPESFGYQIGRYK